MSGTTYDAPTARGAPRLVGLIVGVPTILVGLYIAFVDASLPSMLGAPFGAFGVFAAFLGTYINRQAPRPINFDQGEFVIATYEPSHLVGRLEIAIGAVFFVATVFLLTFTYVPYVYPTLAFVGFLWLTGRGLVRYWTNTLTTYYVTNLRVISEYRFLSLQRKSVRHDDVAATGRTQSVLESLVGLGSVAVSAGGGSPQITEIVFRDIDNATAAERAIEKGSQATSSE